MLNEQHITFEDLVKVSLRIGSVVSAECVPKSLKLLKLSVDFGETESSILIHNEENPPLDKHGLPLLEQIQIKKLRTVLAGIGKSFSPEDVINKQFLFVTNLPPRKMMGIESEGMILANNYGDNIILMTPTNFVAPGSKLS